MIQGNVGKANILGGNGVVARILVNGVQQWSQAIAYNDSVGADFSLDLSLQAGDRVDFVADENGDNTCDWTLFTATFTQERITTYTYDTAGRKIEQSDPDPDGAGPLSSPGTQWAYDSLGQLISVTDARGNQTSYVYDKLGRKVEEHRPDADGSEATGDDAPITKYEYDAVGNLTKVIDPLGNVSGANPDLHATVYVYDYLNRKIEEHAPDADGNAATNDIAVTKYEYDKAGNLTKVINPLGNVSGGDADANSTTYVYDALNRKISQTGPDADGNLLTADAPVTGYGYDASGNLIQVTDPMGHVTSYEYDGVNRKVKETDPDPDGAGARPAAITTWQYDLAGNTIAMVDALGNVSGGDPSKHTTSYEYDALNHQIQQTQPDADGNPATAGDTPITQWSYNVFGELASYTDPAGNVTTYTYDNLGRKLTETNELDQTRSYAYDANGNTISITDRNGRVRRFVYDNLDRQIHEYWMADGSDLEVSTITSGGGTATVTTASAHGLGSGDVVYIAGADQGEYDGFFQITVTGPTTFTYSISGSPASPATGAITAHKVIREIDSTYDVKGQLASESEIDGSSSYDYTYDGVGRLKSVFNFGMIRGPGISFQYSYDIQGRRTGMTEATLGADPYDWLTSYTYDNLDRLTSVSQIRFYPTLLNEKRVDFAYDLDSKTTEMRRYSDTDGTRLVEVSSYFYDSADRLTSLQHVAGGNTIVDYLLEYDVMDRITRLVNADGESLYSYDANGQLLSADNSFIPDEAYSYDANGNRTMSGYDTDADNRLSSDGTYDYQYDGEGNRTLATNTSDNSYIQYTYDFRNRLTDVVFRDSGGTTIKALHYVYDINDNRIIRRLDGDGNGTYETEERYVYDGRSLSTVYNGSNVLVNHYVYGPGEDQLLAQEDGSANVSWTLTDHQGSVRDVIDNSGASISHIIYNAYGNIASGDPGRFAFTGQAWDSDAGLYHYDHRDYDPLTGSFICQDPAQSGDNWYEYVGNDPVNFTDPTGLEAWGNSSTWSVASTALAPAMSASGSAASSGVGLSDWTSGVATWASSVGSSVSNWVSTASSTVSNWGSSVLSGANDFAHNAGSMIASVPSNLDSTLSAWSSTVVAGFDAFDSWLGSVDWSAASIRSSRTSAALAPGPSIDIVSAIGANPARPPEPFDVTETATLDGGFASVWPGWAYAYKGYTDVVTTDRWGREIPRTYRQITDVSVDVDRAYFRWMVGGDRKTTVTTKWLYSPGPARPTEDYWGKADFARAGNLQQQDFIYRTISDHQYFYLEQFGLPALAAVAGGLFQLKGAISEVQSQLGGVGPTQPVWFRNSHSVSAMQNGPIKRMPGPTQSGPSLPDGSFSISDWSGYPEGVPRPRGPFTLLEGADYDAARAAANSANRALRQTDPAAYAGKGIHEVQPVKFGGSPTDLANKVALPENLHSAVTNWWNALMRSINGG